MKDEWQPIETAFLQAIFEYAVAHDLFADGREADLRAAASDVLDGWALREEISGLVRRRVLTPFKLERAAQSISSVTWGLTDKGVAMMREWHATSARPPAPHRNGRLHCPHCGEVLPALSSHQEPTP